MTRAHRRSVVGVTWRQAIPFHSQSVIIEAQEVDGERRIEMTHYYLTGEGEQRLARVHGYRKTSRENLVREATRLAAVLPDADLWPIRLPAFDKAITFAFGRDAFSVTLEPVLGAFPPKMYMVGVKSSLDRPVRSPISTGDRYNVLARDGFKCRYCGRGAPDVELHVDHVVSVKNGGTNNPDNLVAACRECNQGKAAHPLGRGDA